MGDVAVTKVNGVKKPFYEEISLLLQQVLKRMLKSSEDVVVSCVVGTRTITYCIQCHEDDYGQLLGRQGKNIDGLRRIVAAMASQSGYRAVIEVPFVPNVTK